MDIRHISVSRMGVWKQCQQQYKYQYHLKVEINEPEPFYFTFGKILHKIAEEFVNSKGKLLVEEVSRDVINGKIPIETINEQDIFAPKLPAESKKRMPGMLKAIRKLTRQLGAEGQTEYKFKYDLDPPNNRNVVGFIDRLIERDGHFIIIDYKTTRKGPYRATSHSVKRDLQLRCYTRIVQKEFNVDPSKIYAALYYLEGGNIIGAKYCQEDLDAVEKELLQAYKEIENTPPDKAWGNVGDHCTRCKFKKICPFRKLV